MKKQKLLFILLLFWGNIMLIAQNCTVNAGGNTSICGTSYTLQGSSSGSTPVWTLVSKPSGAPNPVISNINIPKPNVTGMTFPGNYVFQLTQSCVPSGSVTSQVTITTPGDASSFTAGPDITNVPASTGIVILNGVIPAGYTAQWRYYQLFSKERYNEEITDNATMTNSNMASPTLSLIKKANHDTDPSYRVILRITSINNSSCWYEDDAIIRFIPNPKINVASISFCGTNSLRYANLSNSPIFDTTQPNSSGNNSFGTTVTLNVISQPTGGNMSYKSIDNQDVNFNGITVPGIYTYTLTISNTSGTYTTPQITFNYQGQTPKEVNFLDSAHPDQMEYVFARTAGVVYCNKIGDSNPITFYYKLNPSDPPSLITTVNNSGTTPPGGAPSLLANGAGTMNRSVTVTPPAGGWRAGTYVVNLSIGSGCALGHYYYIHISDGNRPNVIVNNMTVCYSGTGSVSATVPLPAVYKGMVNSSYFQDFAGRYDFTVVSKPVGSGTPVYQTTNLRTITNTSTTISNLDKEGEYVFKIIAVPNANGVGPFLDKEYACSGTSLEGTFSVFVSAQVGANAGSAQTLVGTSQTTFNGNNPGVATGAWTLVSKPAGATDPLIVTPPAYNTNVTGFNTSGVYTFRWTVTTGTCTSSSDVNITVKANYCTSGCNSNSYVNSSNPNTIEYDNMVSTFHASLAKEKNGTFKVWGQASSSNGTSDLLSPTLIAPINGFNYTGTPLRVAAGSNSNTGHQFALLTTDGLYVWGTSNTLISSSIKNSTAFAKITVNTKIDGLPPGVTPVDVKMMFGSYQTLAILTCNGDAWVLSMSGSKNGDGTTQNSGTPNSNIIWHRVKTSATTDLNNVVAMRGTPNALFALTSEAKLYTWGTSTYINNGAATNRAYATEVTIPAGVIPKMIGMTQASATSQTYYLLATNGKLYAMGNNTNRQLGDGTTIVSNIWKEVAATAGVNTLGGNIVWISPNEHSNYDSSATINVLTNNKKQWAWGANSGNMIGQTNDTTFYNPTYMPGNSTTTNGLNLTDEVIAVETGGHTTINIKKCSQNFGYVGHKTNGSMGDGTNSMGNPTSYSYSTSILVVCGTDAGPKVQEMKICQDAKVNLNDANLEDSNNDVEWHATNDVNSPILNNITAVGPGTYYAFFTVASGKCREIGTMVTVAHYLPTDLDNPCIGLLCYKPGVTTGTVLETKIGITALGRAGAEHPDNWPMRRKGGWIALESKTKAFVPNRLAFNISGNPIGITADNFIEGMMVYDITNKCMKIYTLKDGDTTMAWHCLSTQTCPD